MNRFLPPVAIMFAGALALSPAPLTAGHDEEEGDPRFQELDADGDGRVSRAESAAGAAAWFKAMDRDGDGRVTVAEMDAWKEKGRDANAGIRFLPSGQAEGAAEQVGSGAARSDGTASMHEVANARGAATEPSSAEIIRRADRDGDDHLTAAEYEAMAAGNFKRLDTDGDGYLARAEYRGGV